MTERAKEKQPADEWFHRLDGTSVEVNKQRGEGEEEEIVKQQSNNLSCPKGNRKANCSGRTGNRQLHS
jgi:hypothetical protein